MAAPPYRITINPTPTSTTTAVEYPCSSWEKVDQGKPLTRVWDKGFRDGMGLSVDDGTDRSLIPFFLDVSAPPYVRLDPGVTFISSLTGLDTSLPLYTISAKQPNGVNILYVFNGTYRYKINRDAATLLDVITTASVVYGRPALFEGSWRIARGPSVDAATLTIANDSGSGVGTSDDTLTALTSIKALHFATVQNASVAQIAKAGNNAGTVTNTISLSSDFATFAGGFEVGDTSLAITDLLDWQGELLVIKADGPRRFSVEGDSLPISRFNEANLNSPTYDGANSAVHGPYGYWVSAPSLRRIWNEQITDIGFETYKKYYADAADLIDDSVSWNSIVTKNRWAYGGRGTRAYQGYIENDGTITWLSAIMVSVATVKVALDDTPALWVFSAVTSTQAARLPLQADGSTRSVLGTARGINETTRTMTLPKLNFGTADRLKQLRRMWAILEGMSTCTFQFQAERDGAAVQNVGSGITASGLTEAIPTPGTNDTFRELRPRFTLATTGSTGSDSRVRALGIDCHTLDVYRAVIPLRPDTVKGYSGGIKGLLKKLRHLQGAQRVAVKEPEVNETFTGYILSVSEKVVGAEGGAGVGYDVSVLIERAEAPA